MKQSLSQPRLNRRSFLRRVSGLIVPASLGVGILQAQYTLPTRRTHFKAAAAAGPNTFYYGPAGASPANVQGLATNWFIGAPVTCTTGGSVTKIGCWVLRTGNTGDFHVTISLWYFLAAVWTFHECGVIDSPGVEDLFKDYTLGTPRTVANGAVVRVMYVVENTEVQTRIGGGSGGFFDTRTYANACLVTPPTFNDDIQAGVRVFVA